ncbi:MAG TPA: hypothetical protein VGM41_12365 [Chitinophagaceae bacterium]|jgi:hypothetical protein
MNFDAFQSSLSAPVPPDTLNVYLRALWYDAKDDWKKAHELVQDIENKTATRLHAYLHRKEGDIWNANYWYNKAGAHMPGCSLQKEWEELVKELLAHSISV